METTASKVVDEPMEIELGQDDGEQGRARDIAMEEGAADKVNAGTDRGLTGDVLMDN